MRPICSVHRLQAAALQETACFTCASTLQADELSDRDAPAAHLRLVEEDALACGVASKQIREEGPVCSRDVYIALVLAPLVVLQDAAATCASRGVLDRPSEPNCSWQSTIRASSQVAGGLCKGLQVWSSSDMPLL